MLQSIEGIYRNGTIELLETPAEIKESRVIITFLNENGEKESAKGSISLAELGISKEAAAKQRAALATFAEDWDDPALDVYNDYDNALRRTAND